MPGNIALQNEVLMVLDCSMIVTMDRYTLYCVNESDGGEICPLLQCLFQDAVG